jgi:hypothetical protein
VCEATTVFRRSQETPQAESCAPELEGAQRLGPAPHNNEMNQTNRGVPGMKERRPTGEPVLAEVGPPVILSLGVAGYLSVMRHYAERRGPDGR